MLEKDTLFLGCKPTCRFPTLGWTEFEDKGGDRDAARRCVRRGASRRIRGGPLSRGDAKRPMSLALDDPASARLLSRSGKEEGRELHVNVARFRDTTERFMFNVGG